MGEVREGRQVFRYFYQVTTGDNNSFPSCWYIATLRLVIYSNMLVNCSGGEDCVPHSYRYLALRNIPPTPF